jgi:VWFA-related protein
VRSGFGALLLAAVLANAAPDARSQFLRLGSRFSSGVEVVGITATVLDADGRLVSDLPAEAFEAYEDGEPQPITQFTSARVPVSLAVLLDVSDSMYGRRIADERAAVARFLRELLDPDDEFMLLSFNHRPHALTEWTRDPQVLQSALDGLVPFGGTAIYDAVMTALPFMDRRSRERAALLVISDGADSASDATLTVLRSAMLRSDAFAYAIAIDSPDTRAINAQVNPSTLREITDTSGGRTEVVADSADLAAATARIADELNHQYVLGYNAPHGADGRYHSIRVRIAGGGGYQVRTRRGYVAEPRALPRP